MLSNDLYRAKRECCHVCEQFVQDFVESHPICEVCEKILPKTQRSIVRILTYCNLHMRLRVSYHVIELFKASVCFLSVRFYQVFLWSSLDNSLNYFVVFLK